MCAENMRLNFSDGARARVEDCPHDLLGEVASIERTACDGIKSSIV